MNLLKNRTVLGIICITLSLMICFAPQGTLSFYFAKIHLVITLFRGKEMAQKTEIVRVTTAIQTGQAITKDMVTVMEVGGYNLPETVIKNTETVIGSYALADFSAGDYILAEKVSDSLQAENAYLYHLDGTQHRITTKIP
ncbi:MAG: SAF domain-containing protein [Eubacteriales bacterium]